MPDLATASATHDLTTLAGRLSAAWDVVRGRPFSPGAPLPPTVDQTELDQGARQWQYPVGANIQIAPRGEVPTLAPFAQLRNLARLYPPAAICIRTRIEEFQGLGWAVVAKDKRRQAALQPVCDALQAFWAMPDRQNEFASWLAMALRDVFEIDALALYPRRDRAGRLYALEPVDGTTIKPLLNDRGAVAAYQQVLYGMPWGQYGRPQAVEVVGEYAPHELIYRPRMPRTDSPYGTPPAEDIILTVNTGLRKISQDLAHFTDGNIPPMIANPPDATLDPKQLQQFEEWFNAVLAGNDAARSRIRFVPWPLNLKELRPFSYDTELDLWMLQLTFAAYGVPPQEAGFTHDTNRATAESQQNVNERRGLKPLAVWMKGLFDRVIQAPVERGGQGQPQLEWQWTFGESEDRKAQAEIDKIYTVDIGALSPTEVRAMRFGSEVDGPAPAPPEEGAAPPQPPLPSAPPATLPTAPRPPSPAPRPSRPPGGS